MPMPPTAGETSTPSHPYIAATAAERQVADRIRWGLMAFAYGALIVYGSLYPFSGWSLQGPLFGFLFDPAGWVRRPSLGDVVTNLLAYVPFGFFAFRGWRSTRSPTAAGILAGTAAIGLSLGIELLQGFLPARVQSPIDLLLNAVGGLSGVALANLSIGTGQLPSRVRQLRAEWFRPGRLIDVGLVALAAWVLAQLLPVVPSLDVGKFRSAFVPLERVLADPGFFNAWQLLAETLNRTGMGLAAVSLIRRSKPAFQVFSLLLIALLLAQIPIVDRELLPEAIVASVAALLGIALLRRLERKVRASCAFFLLFSGFCIAETLGSGHGVSTPFSWIPFSSSLVNTATGIREITSAIGLAAALAWSARTAGGSRSLPWLGWAAGLLLVGGAMALELNQTRIGGRTGDVTMPLLLAITWITAWRHGISSQELEQTSVFSDRPTLGRGHPPPPSSRSTAVRIWKIGPEALTIAVVGIAIGLGSQMTVVPYNVRELFYAGHPLHSALMLSLALYLTLAVPAWLTALCRQRPALLAGLPFALILNASVAWVAVDSAVPSESIHDIVGAPVLNWPGEIEVALRFMALHAAVTMLVAGAALLALSPYEALSRRLFAGWLGLFAILAPAFYWAIVSQAATDNLTELMRGGGTPVGVGLLAMSLLLGFVPGSLGAAVKTLGCRSLPALGFGIAAVFAAYVLLVAGTESAIQKYGQQFSALQFLLSVDRRHYAGPAEVGIRYAAAYLLLTVAVTAFQSGAWRFIASGGLRSGFPSSRRRAGQTKLGGE